uniref:Uncharacterized protein n=1 Tax=Pipistrellus kuhlii TaxID=59472 RepID=A0A7J7W3B1_PIPKU|nr:hypothetical protein mPipKuh1_008185 [Pipistrellus kuhlii]
MRVSDPNFHHSLAIASRELAQVIRLEPSNINKLLNKARDETSTHMPCLSLCSEANKSTHVSKNPSPLHKLHACVYTHVYVCKLVPLCLPVPPSRAPISSISHYACFYADCIIHILLLKDTCLKIIYCIKV